MPRKPHKYHYIYKTTCTVTRKYYIGMHSTSNLEDGYMGSGKKLKLSLNKWGRENHTTEILEFLPDRITLKSREKEIVNETLIKDPQCMNLCLGGEGVLGCETNLGWKWANEYWNVPENKKRQIDRGKKLMSIKGGHTDETRLRMSITRKGRFTGEQNSASGKIWMRNEELEINKRINESDVSAWESQGWKVGRRMFNKC